MKVVQQRVKYQIRNSKNTKVNNSPQRTWRVAIVISVLLFITACSDYLTPLPATSLEYAVLPIAPSQSAYGATLTLNYNPTELEFVEVVSQDAGTVHALTHQLQSTLDNTTTTSLNVALVRAQATRNTLGYVVFKVNQEGAAVDVTSSITISDELKLQSELQTHALTYVRTPPQPI